MVKHIIIGQPLVEIDKLGIDTDHDVVITLMWTSVSKQGQLDQDIFLPHALIQAGLFKTTSEVKQVAEQRRKSTKITDPLEKELWRNVDQPEFSHFKIGKREFWLVVGDRDKY